MARIERILRLARQTLGDKDADRWSNQDLLDLLDRGHKDLCHHTRILRGDHSFALAVGQAIYTLPDDIHFILRAEWDQCKVDLVTYDHMDEQGKKQVLSRDKYDYFGRSRPGSDFDALFNEFCWQTETGNEPIAIVYDKSNLNEIRVYPVPNEDIEVSSYNFVAENPPFVGAELYGVVAAIDDYTFDSVFGVVTQLFDPTIDTENFLSDVGVVSGINESTGLITLRYIRTPPDITEIDDALLLTPRYLDTALQYYIVGHALRNDLDVRNVERGNNELQFYLRELAMGQETVNKEGTRSVDHSTTYRSGFE